MALGRRFNLAKQRRRQVNMTFAAVLSAEAADAAKREARDERAPKNSRAQWRAKRRAARKVARHGS